MEALTTQRAPRLLRQRRPVEEAQADKIMRRAVNNRKRHRSINEARGCIHPACLTWWTVGKLGLDTGDGVRCADAPQKGTQRRCRVVEVHEDVIGQRKGQGNRHRKAKGHRDAERTQRNPDAAVGRHDFAAATRFAARIIDVRAGGINARLS